MLDDIEKGDVPNMDKKNESKVRSYLDDGLEYDEATYQRFREELRIKKATETHREVISNLYDGLEYD